MKPPNDGKAIIDEREIRESLASRSHPVGRFKAEFFATVVLVHAVAEHGLRAGDLGAVVATHPPDGLEVEFVTASGRTTALVSFKSSDVRASAVADSVTVRTVARSA